MCESAVGTARRRSHPEGLPTEEPFERRPADDEEWLVLPVAHPLPIAARNLFHEPACPAVVLDPLPHAGLKSPRDVQLVRSSFFAAHQIQTFMQLAAGAFTSCLAAYSLSNLQGPSHQPSLVDQLGQL